MNIFIIVSPPILESYLERDDLRYKRDERAYLMLTGCPINLVKFKKENPKSIPRGLFQLNKGLNMRVSCL